MTNIPIEVAIKYIFKRQHHSLHKDKTLKDLK